MWPCLPPKMQFIEVPDGRVSRMHCVLRASSMGVEDAGGLDAGDMRGARLVVTVEVHIMLARTGSRQVASCVEGLGAPAPAHPSVCY